MPTMTLGASKLGRSRKAFARYRTANSYSERLWYARPRFTCASTSVGSSASTFLNSSVARRNSPFCIACWPARKSLEIWSSEDWLCDRFGENAASRTSADSSESTGRRNNNWRTTLRKELLFDRHIGKAVSELNNSREKQTRDGGR